VNLIGRRILADRLSGGSVIDGGGRLHQDPGIGLEICERHALFPRSRDEPRRAGVIARRLGRAGRWITAISQGDPTEPNITEPLYWLDFEHAGRNALAADLANFLWYLLGMGGWLVPAYQPHVYQRTLRTPFPRQPPPSSTTSG
jgi:hypothetical protein